MAPPQLNLLRPLLIMGISLSCLPMTVVNLVISLRFDELISWPKFQSAWFGRFWTGFGPQSRAFAGPTVVPILQQAKGVVLDLGPGSGQWLDLFSPSTNKGITKIYGVEPNKDQHASLRANIKKAGLEGVYEVLGVGVEALESCGIPKGSIDTITTIQVLCSVPRPESIIKELYPYLRPGGQWLVYEHVKTPFRHDVVATWQKFLDLVWPHVMGGCEICRPTDEWILQAGKWESADLHPGADEGKWDTLPHSMGRLVKAG